MKLCEIEQKGQEEWIDLWMGHVEDQNFGSITKARNMKLLDIETIELSSGNEKVACRGNWDWGVRGGTVLVMCKLKAHVWIWMLRRIKLKMMYSRLTQRAILVGCGHIIYEDSGRGGEEIMWMNWLFRDQIWRVEDDDGSWKEKRIRVSCWKMWIEQGLLESWTSGTC